MGTLYLYAVDPGAFSVMSPIWRTAVTNGIDARWVAAGFAARRLREQGQAFEPDIANVIRKSSTADTILFGAQMNWSDNIANIKAANAKGIATHFLFDHWCFYRENFLSKGRLCLPNGHVFAIDGYEKKLLVKNGIAARKIRVVGHPAIAETERRSATSRRDESSRRVLFLSEPISADFGTDKNGKPLLGYDERDALRLLAETLAQRSPGKYEILVKAHPREDVKALAASLAGRIKGVRLRFTAKGDPIKMILGSKFVFGISTILLLHAIRLGKITGSLQPGRTKRGRENSNAHLERVLGKNGTDIVELMKAGKPPLLDLPTDPSNSILRDMGAAI